MNKLKRAVLFIGTFLPIVILAVSSAFAQPPTRPLKTRNVVLIVSDGLRWQEIFTGADSTLMDSEHGGVWADAKELKRKFWSNDIAERRRALFPFLWSVVAKQGELYGNQTQGSVARVINGMAFSYPGYNEMLTGYPDPKIDRNEFGPNPNLTVFEWLNHMPEFRGKVAVYGTWTVFKDIFNEKRSGLVHAGGMGLAGEREAYPAPGTDQRALPHDHAAG
ncbi:MAG: hypothetical protein ACXVZH_04600 [Terriglobales bacterium]